MFKVKMIFPKNKSQKIDHKSISDFNSIINTNFKKRNKGNQ